jgi:CheY-like chemotaxis protein
MARNMLQLGVRHWSVGMGESSIGSPVVKQGDAVWSPSVIVSDGATLLLSLDEALLRGTETILFVEDQSFVREVAGKILKSAGYRVLAAKSAAEASRAYELASGAIDLLLTDIILPRESGRELARELRRQNPLLCVLLITGYTEQMVKSETETEFGECFPKPFSARALLQRVREVLDARVPDFGESDLRLGDQREGDSRANAILSCAPVLASSLHDVRWNFGQGQDPQQNS